MIFFLRGTSLLGTTEEKIIYVLFYSAPLSERQIREGLKRKSSVYKEINRLIKKGYLEKPLKKDGKKYYAVSMKGVELVNKAIRPLPNVFKMVKNIRKWVMSVQEKKYKGMEIG